MGFVLQARHIARYESMPTPHFHLMRPPAQKGSATAYLAGDAVIRAAGPARAKIAT